MVDKIRRHVRKSILNVFVLDAVNRAIFRSTKEQIVRLVERLASDLRANFPDLRGFSANNGWLMRQFYVKYAKPHFLLQLVLKLKKSAEMPFLAQAVADLAVQLYYFFLSTNTKTVPKSCLPYSNPRDITQVGVTADIHHTNSIRQITKAIEEGAPKVHSSRFSITILAKHPAQPNKAVKIPDGFIAHRFLLKP